MIGRYHAPFAEHGSHAGDADISESTAYQLLHIFLHELGHHCDRMSTKSRRDSGRGEPFAEEWAYRYERVLWDRYLETFGLSW